MGTLERLEQFDFHHRLAETAGLALVVFTGPACGACRRLKAELAERGDALPPLQLFEVDAQQDMGLVEEFGVFHLPALFLFRDGHYHREIQAPPVATELRRAIEAALAQPPAEAP